MFPRHFDEIQYSDYKFLSQGPCVNTTDNCDPADDVDTRAVALAK